VIINTKIISLFKFRFTIRHFHIIVKRDETRHKKGDLGIQSLRGWGDKY